MNTQEKIRRQLHILWTKAVGTEKYVKAEWKEMDVLIETLISEARNAPRSG